MTLHDTQDAARRVQRETPQPPSSSSELLSSLELSDTKVYKPQIRALLGTASHFCQVDVFELRAVPIGEAR